MEIREFTDAELFTMFNVDCGQLVAATNDQVDESLRIEGEDLTPLYGVDLWDARFPRKGRFNVDSVSPEELRRLQRAERAERVNRLAELASNLEQMEADDVPICELIEAPKYATPRLMQEDS